MSQLNLLHGTDSEKVEKERLKSKKTDMLRSIGKHSRESVESVLKKQEAQLSPRDRAMRRAS